MTIVKHKMKIATLKQIHAKNKPLLLQIKAHMLSQRKMLQIAKQ